MTTHPRSPRRLRRAAAMIGKVAGLLVVFVLAVVGGVLLHAGMRAPRMFTVERVNAVLEGSFKGRVAITEVGVLRLDRLGEVSADVFDPEGQRVIQIEGASVRFGLATIVRSLLGDDRLKIDLFDLRVRHAEVRLEDDANGDIGLVRAFEAKEPDLDAEPSPGTEVRIEGIRLGHAWIHGRLAAVPIIDVDLDMLVGSFGYAPESTRIEVERLGVRGRGIAGLSPVGVISASVTLPAEAADREVRARYEGALGDIPLSLDASVSGDEVDAVVDVHRTEGAAFDAIAADALHLSAPIEARAEVHGVLPILYPMLDARIGDGSVFATGLLSLPSEDDEELAASVDVDVRHVDLAALSRDLPASDLTAWLSASVISRPGGELEGDFALESDPGAVDAQIVPAAKVDGRFSDRGVIGDAFVAEVGAPTRARFSWVARGDSPTPNALTFATRTDVPNLDGIARVGRIGKGRATLRTEGTIDLATQSVEATAEGRADQVLASGVKVAGASVEAAVSGTLSAPLFNVRVLGRGLEVAGYGFERFTAGASGTVDAIDVDAAVVGRDAKSPSGNARARVSTKGGVRIERASVEVRRNELFARVLVDTATVLTGGGVDVRGATLEGLGDPLRAEARYLPGQLRAKVTAPRLDLTKLGRLLAREEEMRGTLSIDVDAKLGRRDSRGRVAISARDVHVQGIEGGEATVAATLEGQHLTAAIDLSLEGVLAIRAETKDVLLGGSLLAPKTLSRTTGGATLNGRVDVAALLERLPPELRPLSRGRGTITLGGTVSRKDPKHDPSFELEVATKGLALVGKEAPTRDAKGELTQGPTPWQIEDVDADVRARFEGESGKSRVDAKLRHRAGPLASIEAESTLPVKKLMAPEADLVGIASELPLVAHVVVPRRPIATLPNRIGTDLEGTIAARLDLEGTAKTPKVALSLEVDDLGARSSLDCERSIDLDAKLAYDGKNATLDLVSRVESREALSANVALAFDVAQLFQKKDLSVDTPLAWEASASAKIDRFPLETANAFLAQPIGGTLDGELTVASLHRDATLKASFVVKGLSVERAKIPTARLRASIDAGAFLAEAHIEQPDGNLRAKVGGAATWGDAIVPDFDLKKPVDVSLDAKNFRIAAVRPLAGDTFSELDGRIDSRVKLQVLPGGKDGTFDGAIVLREGVIAVPQIGERFNDVSARLVMKPWGTIRLEKLTARGPTGRLEASGEAVMDGLAFQRADARVAIPEGESIPIAVEGVPMGRAYGNIQAKAAMKDDGKKLDIRVDVPVLKVDLPQSTGNSVQELDPDEKIRVGYHDGQKLVTVPLRKPEEPKAPSDLAIRAEVKLKNEIQIQRDTMLNVFLRGGAVVEITDKTRVTGEIRLMRGQIELQGKIFEIERGIVSFVGDDPGNPMIQATAYWDAPGDVRVYAEFSGRVSEGNLTLRSEPPYSQDELLALLLFGSTDGALGASTGETSTGVAAVGLAGGVVTQGLNKIISGVTPKLSTRIDSSEANSPQPQIVFQVTKDVTASLGYKLGVPAPGADPDRAQLTLDWRFIRNWSLDTKVGDQGSTSVDVIWRMRY